VISVIIPAHNEQGRIQRLLDALVDERFPLAIVVVANACTDATAAQARAYGPAVHVIELEEASKVAALNAGEESVVGFPRFYVDADIVITAAELTSLAEALVRGPALLAAPERHWDTTDSPWVVRSYVRLLEALPQVQGALLGGGVLGVSEQGRRRFDRFPPVLGDDRFLHGLFLPEERLTVHGATAHVRMPTTLGGLIARRTRVVRVNREPELVGARDRNGTLRSDRSSVGRWTSLRIAIRTTPRLVLDLPAFLVVTAAAELRARLQLLRGHHAWDRDDSSR
jgi:hypothetical protein